MRSSIAAPIRAVRAAATRFVGYRRLRALAAQGLAPIPVLFYHRVCDEYPNDWTLGRRDFQRHIDCLRKSFEIIGLDEVQRRIAACNSHRPAAAITFDDGYADNNEFALPLIVRHRLPCTYFVSVQNILDARPFPHDVAAGRPLAPNTADDLRGWADQGIEIGLHTHSHFDFSQSDDPRTIEREIFSAADQLSAIVGRRVQYFAFPYGLPPQLRPAVIRAVRQAGMSGFCSAFGAYNVPGRDAFHIRRVHGDPEFSRFINWIYFDRRKLAHEPSVTYDLDLAATRPPTIHNHVCSPTI